MKALIAMSGGVDSSVAAYLMKEDGYECIGATMRLYDPDPAFSCENSRTCCSEKDVFDAGKVALRLGMPFEVLDYREEFKESVINNFIKTYESGGTPNPCIECNRRMKFDKMLELAVEIGADCIVTGHYARIELDEISGRYLLKKGLDDTKDQSYVLYTMTQDQLARTKFPLGEMRKSDVRNIAEKQNFKNAYKRDSQDICFVPNGDYAGFLEGYTGKAYPEGDFVSADGEILGRHRGIVRYTIGQRKGLGISSDAPLYVTRINAGSNEVEVSHGDGLYHKEILISDINMISVPEIGDEMRVAAKIRYRHTEQPATAYEEIRECSDGTSERVIRLIFDEAQRAPTIGQSAVLYDGDVVIGGGIISEIID